MGPCMCGDPYCGSCGPAQGFDQELLAMMDRMSEELTGKWKSYQFLVADEDGQWTSDDDRADDLVEWLAEYMLKEQAVPIEVGTRIYNRIGDKIKKLREDGATDDSIEVRLLIAQQDGVAELTNTLGGDLYLVTSDLLKEGY